MRTEWPLQMLRLQKRVQNTKKREANERNMGTISTAFANDSIELQCYRLRPSNWVLTKTGVSFVIFATWHNGIDCIETQFWTDYYNLPMKENLLHVMWSRTTICRSRCHHYTCWCVPINYCYSWTRDVSSSALSVSFNTFSFSLAHDFHLNNSEC